MLVDAAKKGDVEIPVFCYEPKLGEPVGACRMCLVEIEGMPKLQTACSTPVRDGMVVYTQTDRVKEAQNAVVEFLLVNHPLDCPVCDKGGECPLQDIAMGWGPGKSRFTDPKRHFQKPLELSPLIAIDRERCILCYRCVRFSQEVAEDEQLQLLERGDKTFVGTFDERPVHRPLPRQHHRALPRRRADLLHLPLPRAALGHRAGRLDLHPLPEPVQRRLHRPRRAGPAGARPRQRRGRRRLALRQGPLRLPDVQLGRADHRGRWSAPATAASARSAGTRRVEAGRGRAPERRRAGAPRSSAAAPPTRRAGWSSGSSAAAAPRTSTARPNPVDPALLGELSRPDHGARMADLDHADAILVVGVDPLHEMPILDLRIRKAVRRSRAKLMVASERPTALDGGAEEAVRYAPGDAASFLRALAGALGARGLRRRRARSRRRPRAIAETLRDAPDQAIVWGERLWRNPGAVEALHACMHALDMHKRIGPGLLEVPEESNTRGLREVGCLPGAKPGLECDRRRPWQRPDQGRPRRPRARRPPARQRRPGSHLSRLRRLAEGAVRQLRRLDRLLRGRVDPARRHRHPGRDPRREGGHGHPSRGPPPAPAPQRPPARRHDRRLALPRRRRRGARRRTRRRGSCGGLRRAHRRGPVLRGADLRGDRRHGAALGRQGTGPLLDARRRRRRGAGGAPPPTPRAGRRGWCSAPTATSGRADVTKRNPALRFLMPKQKLELAAKDAEAARPSNGDAVTVSVNGHSVEATRRDPRADARGRRLPDRGNRRGQREPAHQRRPAAHRGERSDEPSILRSPTSTTSRRPG